MAVPESWNPQSGPWNSDMALCENRLIIILPNMASLGIRKFLDKIPWVIINVPTTNHHFGIPKLDELTWEPQPRGNQVGRTKIFALTTCRGFVGALQLLGSIFGFKRCVIFRLKNKTSSRSVLYPLYFKAVFQPIDIPMLKPTLSTAYLF